MPGSALFVGVSHAVGAGCADGVAAAVVFVVGGDVADRFVQPDAVVVDPDAFEFGGEHGRVGDRRQVWVLAFDVAPQRLDPRLVGRGRRAPKFYTAPRTGGSADSTVPASGSVRRAL